MHELKDLMPEIEKFAKEKMVKDILHGWPHVERVLKYASKVNKEMQGNWEMIKCAILLHDMGHKMSREKHNELSAQMAEEYLIKKSVHQDTIANIKNSILVHSRQFANQKPSTIEAEVVFDADGMDLFGPIGLLRGLLSCALRNEGFGCMIKKMEWRIAQKSNFYSKTAKKFVNGNSEIIENYLKELKDHIQLIQLW